MNFSTAALRRIRFSRNVLLILAALLVVLTGLGTPQRARAATITVNNLGDSGAGCDLRNAVIAANTDTASAGCPPGFGADVITFSVTGTIMLGAANPPITITSAIDIQGPGARQLTVDGNQGARGQDARIFVVNAPNLTVSISGMTLTNGRWTEGAARNGGGAMTIDNTAVSTLMTVNLDRLSFTNNQVIGLTSTVTTVPFGGGALFVRGRTPTVNITNSTFSGNTVNGPSPLNGGGAIAISTRSGTAAVNIVNTTISGNSANGHAGIVGGGINGAFMTLSIYSSTLAWNTSAGLGGNLNNSGGTVNATNSIFANGTAVGNPDFSGVLTSGGYNLIENTAGTTGTIGSDITGVDPALSGLANNGGPTDTHAITTSSSTYNAANPAGCSGIAGPIPSDQRQPPFPRVVNGRCDIGAYELVPPPTLTKAFAPTAVGATVPSTVTITFQNNSNQVIGLTGPFTDTMPAGLTTVASTAATTCASGTASQTPNSVTLSVGAVIPAGSVVSANPPVNVTPGTCTLTVQVTGNTPGIYPNTIAPGDLLTSLAGSNQTGAAATLTILAPPTISKAFSPNPGTISGPSTLTFTLTNPNAVALSGMAFTDNLTSGLTVSSPLITGGTCTSVTFSGTTVAGGSVIGVTSGNIPANSSCTVTINVRAFIAGTYPNVTSGVTTTETPLAGNPAPNVDYVVNALLPTISKSFSPNPVGIGTPTTLTFTITHGNAVSLTGMTFSDTLAPGLVIASPLTTGGSCPGATFSAGTVAGGSQIDVIGGSIPPASSCTITINVVSNAANTYPNLTTGVDTVEAPIGNPSAQVNLVVTASPPAITKVFAPASVGIGVPSTITFTITNTNGVALTGMTFSDTLAPNLVLATPLTTGGTCANVTFSAGTVAGGSVIDVTAGDVPANGSCTITADVVSSFAGVYPNTTTGVDTNETGIGTGAPSVDLAVTSIPATISKGFSPSSVMIGQTSTITVIITNPNAAGLTGITFSDTLAANVVVATPLTTGGTCANVTFSAGTVAGGSVIDVTAGDVPANGSCTVTVNVVSSVAGVYPNTTTGVDSAQTVIGTPASSVDLTVTGTPPTISKAFVPTNIAPGGTSTMTITITNPAANQAALAGVAVSDTFPAGMTMATPLNFNSTCGGTITPAPAVGNNTFALTGGTIAQNGFCTITINVTSSTAGPNLNTTGNVSSTNAGTGTNASATLTVGNPPTVAKSFLPTSIASGGTSTMTITITNPAANAFGLTGVALSDTFPAGMVMAAAPNFNSTCGGTITPLPAAGNNSFALTNGTIAQNGSCTITVDVTSTTAGDNVNTTGAISTTETGTGGTATATLNVVAAPTITKSFTPTSIASGGISTLTLTITNPAGNTVVLSGVAVSDTFPAGLSVAAAPNFNSTCGGSVSPGQTTGDTSIVLTSGTVGVGGSCTITVDVTSSTPGASVNTTGNVSSTNGGTGTNASATLTVVTGPTITKSFAPTTIAPGGTSTMTITITNPAGNTVALSGVAVTDTFPAGMTMATPLSFSSTCGGTITPLPAAGNNSFGLSNGTINVGGSCTITVAVTSSTPGDSVNTTSNVSSTNGGTGTNASATLTVATPPSVTKSFLPTSIASGGTSTMTITITNPAANAFGLTGVALSDTFPAGMVMAAAPNFNSTCGGTITPLPAAGNNSFALTNGTIAQNGSCTITVDVTSTTAGDNVNTTSAVSTTNAGSGSTATATLNVVAAPTITKSFTPTSIASGGTSTLTLTITNPAGNTVALAGVAVSDTFPVGLSVAASPNFNSTCGGSVTPGQTVGDTSITLTSGTVGVGGSCTITVDVTSSTPGDSLNTTGNVSSTNGGIGLSANATLTIVAAPTITKSFSPTTIVPGGTSTLTITITNPAANTVALSGVAVTDTFPAGMTMATPLSFNSTCGGTITPAPAAGNNNFALSNGTINAGGSCTIAVAVTSSTPGASVNTTGNVSSTNGGTGTNASATLSVFQPPQITKAFNPVTIGSGGVSQMTITITNPNAGTSLTGVGFTDAFPAGLAIAGTPGLSNSCGGTFTPAATAGGTALNLSGASIPAGISCTITVNVTSTTLGTAINTTGNVTSNEGGAGNAASADLSVVASAPPQISKAFSPATIPSGGVSTMTITIVNPNAATAQTGVAFSDSFPAGLSIASPTNLANTCGGTFTPVIAAGGTALNLSGGTIGAGGSCTITVNVTSSTLGAAVNTTGAVSSTNSGTGNTASATLTVASIAPPSVSKTFNPAAIAAGGISTLTLTITNPNAVDGLTGITLVDPFPAGMSVATTPNFNNTCGGAVIPGSTLGDTAISLSGGALAGGASCTITVDVTSSTLGDSFNVTQPVTSTNGGTGNSASALLTVLDTPSIAKSFVPANIAVGGTSVLTLTITNPNAGVPLANVSVTDVFPAGVSIAGAVNLTNTCGGTLTPAPAPGNTSIALSGGTVPAGGSCTLSVNVTSSTLGLVTNTTGVVTAGNAGAGNTASADLDVTTTAAPSISKSFTPATIPVGGISTLTITIINPNPATALNGLAFSDTFPAGMTVAAAPNPTNTCGGVVAPGTTAGDTALNLTGGTLAGGASCTITVDVTSSTLGAAVNTTSTVTSTTPGAATGNTASATLNVLTVVPPTITKTFAPSQIQVGGVSRMTIALTNPNPGTALTGVGFSDPFPAGMSIAVPSNATSTCTGIIDPGIGTSLTLTGADLIAGGTCTIETDVTSTIIGVVTNVAGPVNSTNAGIGNAATAQLAVGDVPSFGLYDPALSKIGILQPGQLGLVGEQIAWQITLINRGGVTGQNVVVSDTLVPELRIDGAETSKGSFAINGQTVTFNIGTVDPGETVTMRIFTTVVRNPNAPFINNEACTTASNANTLCARGQIGSPSTLPATGYEDVPAAPNPWVLAIVGLLCTLSAVVAYMRRRRRA